MGSGILKFFLDNRLVTFLLVMILVAWGLVTAPFDWKLEGLPRDPVPVDAIPDIGENQQIVYTSWMGRSPQDVEDQITYPLTTAMLGMPGVASIRSSSMFGLSFIAIIFDEEVDYYWSRTRILEKLSALGNGLLPEGVTPQLGPDATALGQVFWYTLEGRDEGGNPAGGWDLHELRSIQDYYVRYGLMASDGVAEVASIGGYVKEYQVDLDPTAMQINGIGMMAVMDALKNSNLDIGANTLEINRVEYYVRGLGYVQSLEDIEETVVKTTNNVPIRIKDIARVNIGPAVRGHEGILDKGGAEAVGGVVVARYGDNPLQVIDNVKNKIAEISNGLPSKKLADGRTSQLTIVPFYDRSGLIYETLDTLKEAISLQILITIIVIVIMVMHLRTSILIASLLPLAVFICFILMRYFHVDANIVALSGIAIAIGTMVDLGIILSENILRHLEHKPEAESLGKTIFEATKEVSSAIITAVSTTIISFLPVFTLEAAEGKLFEPLAYTKSFALLAALLITLLMLPAFAYLLFKSRFPTLKNSGWKGTGLLILGGIFFPYSIWGGVTLLLLGLNDLLGGLSNANWWRVQWKWGNRAQNVTSILIIAVAVTWQLAQFWQPLEEGSFLFTLILIGGILGIFSLFIKVYPTLLRWCLEYKLIFLIIPVVLMGIGWLSWRGTEVEWLRHKFPGMGKEFMPALDEGSFLLMPTSMPHSGVTMNNEYLKQLDLRVESIPEVAMVVGKAGRVESALDPAPMSMFENIITYHPEYSIDANGGRVRNWRPHIQSPDDIWKEIQRVTSDIPGVTAAPKLQPIETRLVMLQTGMRAPMGIKVFGPDLESIAEFGFQLEKQLKEAPGVKAEAVFADRTIGKPYLEIEWNRLALSKYGLTIGAVQQYLEVAVGGMTMSTTVEGRARYAIRARYAREYRDDPNAIASILIPTSGGIPIPLGQLAEISYRVGPSMIKGEDAFLVGYVLFDKLDGWAEGDAVESASQYLNEKIANGELNVPKGINYRFSGSYENQIRAEKRLSLIVPLVLILIFLILYFQFQSVGTSLMIFSSIALAFAGGFIMLWLYSQPWFLNIEWGDQNLRNLFSVQPFNLSVAVWVGFIALFGIATDDGVVISTYLKQSFEKNKPQTVSEVRQAVLDAGIKRVRPCLMTTATTLLALVPVLTSTGRGADIMIPMAIPAFGGMTIALITLFLVPVLYGAREEIKLKWKR
jgi:Cu(I)/Ag(I) efflux system membrane protein CusA/SilA